MNRKELSNYITEKILDNLHDRRGFRHLLDEIRLEDEETYNEIKEAISDIIENSIIHNEN